MRNLIKALTATGLVIMMTNSFAIQVNVQSTSKVDGIGYMANGSQHGGMGSSYQGSNMPVGNYKFGVRVHGKDVGCFSKSGKRAIKINHDTNAVLYFNGRKCVVNLR